MIKRDIFEFLVNTKGMTKKKSEINKSENKQIQDSSINTNLKTELKEESKRKSNNSNISYVSYFKKKDSFFHKTKKFSQNLNNNDSNKSNNQINNLPLYITSNTSQTKCKQHLNKTNINLKVNNNIYRKFNNLSFSNLNITRSITTDKSQSRSSINRLFQFNISENDRKLKKSSSKKKTKIGNSLYFISTSNKNTETDESKIEKYINSISFKTRKELEEIKNKANMKLVELKYKRDELKSELESNLIYCKMKKLQNEILNLKKLKDECVETINKLSKEIEDIKERDL